MGAGYIVHCNKVSKPVKGKYLLLLGFPPPVVFILPRGSGFCDANPGDPGVGVGVCLYRQNGSKTIGFQWLTGYVQSDYLFL